MYQECSMGSQGRHMGTHGVSRAFQRASEDSREIPGSLRSASAVFLEGFRYGPGAALISLKRPLKPLETLLKRL